MQSPASEVLIWLVSTNMPTFDFRQQVVAASYKYGEPNGAIQLAGYAQDAGKHLLMVTTSDHVVTDGVSFACCRAEVEAIESVSRALSGRPEGSTKISLDLLDGVTWNLELR